LEEGPREETKGLGSCGQSLEKPKSTKKRGEGMEEKQAQFNSSMKAEGRSEKQTSLLTGTE